MLFVSALCSMSNTDTPGVTQLTTTAYFALLESHQHNSIDDRGMSERLSVG